MGATPLVPCACCERHVRGAPPTCPFCGAPFVAREARPSPGRGRGALTRAALVFASAAAVAACRKEAAPKPSDAQAEEPPNGGGTVVALYGPPPMTTTPPPNADAGGGLGAGDAGKRKGT